MSSHWPSRGGEREKLTVASNELYKLLVEPVLVHIRGKELIIVPNDVLHYLPFHALQSPDGKYLIEKYPVYYLSSASLLQFATEKRRAGASKVLAFGNPDLGDPQKVLEFAELEAEQVKAVYPDANVFVRKEATEEPQRFTGTSRNWRCWEVRRGADFPEFNSRRYLSLDFSPLLLGAVHFGGGWEVKKPSRQRGVGGITKSRAVTYTLSDEKRIQKVTDVVTGTGSVVRAVSFQHR